MVQAVLEIGMVISEPDITTGYSLYRTPPVDLELMP